MGWGLLISALAPCTRSLTRRVQYEALLMVAAEEETFPEEVAHGLQVADLNQDPLHVLICKACAVQGTADGDCGGGKLLMPWPLACADLHGLYSMGRC